jgi:hypothetical protein
MRIPASVAADPVERCVHIKAVGVTRHAAVVAE